MREANKNGYIVLTVNLKASDPEQAAIWQELEARAAENEATMSDTIMRAVAVGLAMSIPASSRDKTDLEARVAILESMIENGITLGRHDTLTDIVERVMRGRPAEVKAEDFKGDK